MGIEDTVKSSATMIMWAVHIALGFFVIGEGKVLGYAVNKWFAIGALALSIWIFHLLHKDLLASEARQPMPPPPMPRQEQQQQYQQRPAQRPFEFNEFGGGQR